MSQSRVSKARKGKAPAINSRQSVATRLRMARVAAGYRHMCDFSRAHKLNPNTYRAYENGQRGLGLDEAKELAPLLNVTWDWLFTDGAPEIETMSGGGKIPAPKNQNDDESPSVLTGAWYDIGQLPSNLPIYTITETPGADGWAEWTGEVTELTIRPTILASSRKAYAVRAVGDRMEPRYHAGEVVFLLPGRPCEIGAWVLLRLKAITQGGGDRVALMHLMKRNNENGDLTLEQLNPQRTIKVLGSDVVALHRVVGSWDL